MRTVIAAAALGALALTWQDTRAQLALDPSFGAGGIVKTGFGTAHIDQPFDLRILPDGGILAAGLSESGFDYYAALARYSADGVPDSAGFDGDGKMHTHFTLRDQANGVDVQPDGRIVAVGVQNWSNGVSGMVCSIYRFDPDGEIDVSFADGGWDSLRYDAVSSGIFTNVKVLADGRILAGGSSNANGNGGVAGFGAMRFLPDGSLDPSFDGDGRTRLANPLVFHRGTCLFPPDGGVIWAFPIASGANFELALARVDSTGTRDPGFGTNGIRATGIVIRSTTNFRATLAQDGRILVGCSTYKGATFISQFTALRFLGNGEPDSSFGGDGRVDVQFGTEHDMCFDIAEGPDGRIVLAGRADVVFPRAGLAGLHADGTPDLSFGPGGTAYFTLSGSPAQHELSRVLWLPDGRILAAGSVPNGSAANDFVLARFTLPSGTGVAETAGEPRAGVLGDVFPNPSGGAMTFRLVLPRPDRVSLEVLDVTGRSLWRVTDESFAEGTHDLRWDGRDASGRTTPAGVYFVRLRTSAGTEVGKVTRVR